MSNDNEMPKFKWNGNAEAIYDKSISATPFLFRHHTRNGLNKLLMDRFGEKKGISEAELVQIIKDKTPAPFMQRGMDAIAPHITDSSIEEFIGGSGKRNGSAKLNGSAKKGAAVKKLA